MFLANIYYNTNCPRHALLAKTMLHGTDFAKCEEKGMRQNYSKKSWKKVGHHVLTFQQSFAGFAVVIFELSPFLLELDECRKDLEQKNNRNNLQELQT